MRLKNVARQSVSVVHLLIVTLLFVLSQGALAATVEVVPGAAPIGSRVVLVGSGVADATAVTFSGTDAIRVPAQIGSRGDGFIEVTVPSMAVSGDVRVSTTSGNDSTQFVVAPPAPFRLVSTVLANAGAQTPLHDPEGVAYDPRTGTIFIADTKHHQIKALHGDGQLSVLAGSGVPGLTDGVGAVAQFKEPKGVVLDLAANALYVADSANHVIRRVALAGLVTTFAGSGQPGDRDGFGTAAQFKQPSGVTVDADGAVYVADTLNHKIRRIGADGAVTTLAGTGRDGYANGAASEARFASPEGVVVTKAGVVFVADTSNHRLRAINAGVVTTVAGSGEAGWLDGLAQSAQFDAPRGLALDDAENVLIADSGNSVIRSVEVGTSIVRTIAGSVPTNGRNELIDGSVRDARFGRPRGLVFADALYVADTENDALRRIRTELRLADLYPHRGPIAGGSEVRLFGTGFAAGMTRVSIGGEAVDVVTFVSSTELIATTPPHAARVVDVSVAVGTEIVSLINAYEYVAPPALLSVTPAKGSCTGGEHVTMLGSNFIDGATEFLFGGNTAGEANVADAVTATATTPSAPHGSADVVARTPGGEATLVAGFRFFGAPVITSFTPQSGSAGTVVVIAGDRFDAEASGNVVRFGVASATVTASTSSSIVAIVPPSAVTAPISVGTAGGTVISGASFVVPVLTSISVTPVTSEVAPGATVQLLATGMYSDGRVVDLTTSAQWTTSNAATASVNETGLVTAIATGDATIRAHHDGITGSAQISVKSSDVPPPDPATFAPANDPTVPTRFSDSYRFLHAGPNAVQHDVTPDAIEDERMVVLRGRVVDGNGVPVSGARVSVHAASQLGWTLSRADGLFDIVANGGGQVTVVVEMDGMIPAHRRAAAGWNDTVALDDAVLIPYDTNATVVDLANLTSMTMARGSEVTDSSGYRQATLLFEPGTTATMKLADGTESPLPTITVRATEQTIGAVGAMPAPLPPESAYTYCVELSVDEAVAAGAKTVLFSSPVALYVENFLGLPAGVVVPVGYYDRDKGEWIASENGRVIKVLGVSGGLASLDADGDGTADNALNVSEEERRKLAELYAPGQTVWRALVSHFTPWDANLPGAPPYPAVGPDNPDPESITVLLDDPACQSGSIIECENLSLGKSIPIAGTPLTLEYRSRRTSGFRAARRARIVTSNATLPSVVSRIQLEIQVAGRLWSVNLPPAPNQSYTFEWDGTDVMGRPVYGTTEARVRIGYEYPGGYGYAAPGDRSFGAPTPIKGTFMIEGRRAAVTWYSPEQRFELRANAPGAGIAEGWTVSGVDTIGDGMLYQGNGTESRLNPNPAVFQYFKPPFYAPAPDGAVYWSEFGSIWKFVDGETTFVAGGGSYPAPPSDGGSAVGVYLNAGPIRFDAAGNPIFYDGPTQSLYRLRGGTLSRIAEVPAEKKPQSMVVTPSGAIYYAGNDGGLYRVDGGGNEHQIYRGYDPYAFVALWPGSNDTIYASMYVANGDSGIHRIRLDGSAPEKLPNLGGCVTDYNIAPNGDIYYSRDSLPAGCSFIRPGLFVADAKGETREIKPVTPVVHPGTITFLADGRLLYDEMDSRSVCGGLRTCTRQIGGKFGQDLFVNDIVDPGTGATRRFSATGKHVHSRNAAGDVVWTMQYDADGRITSLRDASGRDTQIERNGSGVATAIIAPGGLRTALTIEADRLKEIAAPGGLVHSFAYSPEGLLTEYRNPRRFASAYTYDTDGRLQQATDAKSKSKTLAHERVNRTDTVSVTTPEGLRTQYEVARIDATTRNRKVTNPADFTTVSAQTAATATIISPDGTRTDIVYGSDPRPGATDTIPTSLTIKTPSGLTSRATFSRSTTTDPNDPTILRSLTDAVVINNRTLTTTLTVATRTVKTTTPTGRIVERTFDTAGRLLQLRAPAVAPVSYAYDSNGRLERVTQGTRQYALGWNGVDRLTSVTDSLSRTTEIAYDDGGRPTTLTLPGNRAVTMTYDANGNLLSLSPPGRGGHHFTYDSLDLPATMTPPGADGAVSAVTYAFDADRRLRSMAEGDRTIDIDYDTIGRVSTISDLVRQLTLGYDSVGRLTSVSNSKGPSLTYTWDGFLEQGVMWTGTIAGSLAWTYDNELRVIGESINGSSIAFGFDADSLLTSAGPVTLTRNTSSGQVMQVATGTATEDYTYNEYGEAKGAVAKHEGATIQSFAYARDNGGRIAAITSGSSTTGYEYDDAGWLERVIRDGATVAEYEYDANGNRLAHRWSGGSATATYDEQDRLLTYGDAIYTYTPDGTLKAKTLAGAATTYDYDAFGNLRNVTLPGGRKIEYVIDGENRRVGKKVDGTLVQGFFYSGPLRVVAELDSANRVVSRFVYASRANVPDSMIRDGVTYRIYSDHLGSPRLVVNSATGAIEQAVQYDEFGNVLSDTNPGFQPFGFAGGLYDRDTRLVRFGARDYEASTGRWTTEDPIGFGGGDANLYAYVGSDPVNYVDPTGLDRYVLIVGDPGLGHHNVGDLFQRAADTYGGTLRAAGHDVAIVRASNVTQFGNALLSGPTITGGVHYFGHSSYDRLYVGEGTDAGTNLDFSNASSLSGSNLGPNSEVQLNSCYAGSGGNQSIASELARRLGRPVIAHDLDFAFSNRPGQFTMRTPKRIGSIYMVPNPRGRWWIFN